MTMGSRRSRSTARMAGYRQAVQSRPFAEKKRKRAAIGWSAAGIAAIAWIFALSRLSFLPGLAIETVDVYGTGPNAALAIQAAAMGQLSGSYLGIFSKANSFIYPKGAIEAAVASASPEIHSFDVSRTGLHTISISVAEKPAGAIVCAELPDPSKLGDQSATTTLSGDCYVADDRGYLFKRAGGETLASTGASDVFYMPDLSDTGLVGTFATATSEFEDVSGFVSALDRAGIHVRSTLIHSGGSYEFYAENPDGGTIVVIQANAEAGLRTERDNLIAFWQRAISEARSKGASVEWNDIKLQYPPNVYYTEATK